MSDSDIVDKALQLWDKSLTRKKTKDSVWDKVQIPLDVVTIYTRAHRLSGEEVKLHFIQEAIGMLAAHIREQEEW